MAGPFELGAGHVRPLHACDPGLVYDATYRDYLIFLCASSGSQIDPTVPCPRNSSSPVALNHPSVVFANLSFTAATSRIVTNVGKSRATYRAVVVEPAGVSVSITPDTLTFLRSGEKRQFTIAVRVRERAAVISGKYKYGSFAWIDGVHEVTSPLVVGFA